MQVDKQIISIRLLIMIIMISLSIILSYMNGIPELIFIPMIVASYYIPFRFRVSLRVIYPRFLLIICAVLIGLAIYGLDIYYQLNFNLLVMALLLLCVLLCFINCLIGVSIFSSIIIFSYCEILQTDIINSGLMIILASILSTFAVLITEYIVFKVVDCNNYTLVNQSDIKALITKSWEQFHLFGTNNSNVSIKEINKILYEIECYLEHINELKQNCIESFSIECRMISDLDNQYNRLSSIYDALSNLVYDILCKQTNLFANDRFDYMKQEDLFN